MARAIGSYPIGHGFKSNSRYHFGPLVKRLRHGPFTAVTWVRFPYGSPKQKGVQKHSFFVLPMRTHRRIHHRACAWIGFANLTKGRSVLAQELLGKFSAESFCSKAPSRTFIVHHQGVFLFCFPRTRNCIYYQTFAISFTNFILTAHSKNDIITYIVLEVNLCSSNYTREKYIIPMIKK